MHPPTPYPASARTKSRMRDTAFREITARANAVSKSEQDFVSIAKKAEEEVAGKLSKAINASRRYSVASKFAGSKTDNSNALSNDIAPGGAKAKLNKRASFASMPQSNGASTQASLSFGKSAAAPSKTLTHKPAVSSTQATNLRSLPKRQSIVPEQAIKPHKPLDLRKRTVYVHEKPGSTQTTHTNKPRGMLLKSASYWLEQIRLAEGVDKHGVSAGFFHLAVECEAEPVELLREELISYVKRHSLWSNAIQQVLLCYGLNNETQYTLFPQLSASGIIKTSVPCTPARKLEAILSNDKDPADPVPEEGSKCPGAHFDSTMSKDIGEESDLKKEALHSQEALVPDASGHIESMDADSVAREVVSYIMSSMNYPDVSYVHAGPTDSSMLVNCVQNKHSSSTLSEAENSVLGIRKSMWTPKSRDPEEAVPQGSPPSLSVWNTLSKEVGIPKLDEQEEVSITLDNGTTDSVSTEKETKEETCVSMELDIDEIASDILSDLQSKSPTYQSASSEESKCLEAQKADETHGNVLKALDVNRSSDEDINRSDEAISAAQNCKESSENLILKESNDKVFEAVQVFENCEIGSHEDSNFEHANPEAEAERCSGMPISYLPESEGNTKSRSSFGGGRSQSGKEKPAPKRAEAPLPKKNSGTASAPQNARRLSSSTPRSSTLVCVPKVEVGSRTGRKSRVSQFGEPGIDNNLLTPTQEARDGTRQLSLSTLEGMDGAIGSMATPGSAGVRRSARLMRPSGGTTISTPGSLSTTRVQRKLGTPMKAETDTV